MLSSKSPEEKLLRTIQTVVDTRAELCSWNFVKALNRRLALNIKALYWNSDDRSLISDSLRNSVLVCYEESHLTSAIIVVIGN